MGFGGHEPPVSLHGPAINLSLLHTPTLRFVWPRCEPGPRIAFGYMMSAEQNPLLAPQSPQQKASPWGSKAGPSPLRSLLLSTGYPLGELMNLSTLSFLMFKIVVK